MPASENRRKYEKRPLSIEEKFQKLIKGFGARQKKENLPAIAAREFSPTRISYDLYGRNFTINT